MFSGLQNIFPTDADLANQILTEERTHRFESFTANDAVTLGLSIRKRFRGSTRHVKGKGMVMSIQTIAGHPLFSCTIGDLGDPGDVSLDSWERLESMVNIVKRTGHSSYYVEKAMSALAKNQKQTTVQGDSGQAIGGAFPIWLENAPCCPIAIIACYSGSSQDDHNSPQLVSTSVRDYLIKIRRQSLGENAHPGMPRPELSVPRHENEEWLPGPQGPHPQDLQSEVHSGFNHHENA
ncbi:hypothetical protein BJ165DRAFT_1520825 [Panaeolus papilionaceus]|nr:hypothetical protein BJ165DRAFT_1520825 [Panaeolus papilionaceus]